MYIFILDTDLEEDIDEMDETDSGNDQATKRKEASALFTKYESGIQQNAKNELMLSELNPIEKLYHMHQTYFTIKY